MTFLPSINLLIILWYSITVFSLPAQLIIDWNTHVFIDKDCYGPRLGKNAIGNFDLVFMADSLSFQYPSCHGQWDILNYSIDTMGFTNYKSCYGGSGLELPVNIYSNSGKDYLLAMSTSNDGDLLGVSPNGNIDIWLNVFNPLDSFKINTLFGGSDVDYPSELYFEEDGSILLLGNSASSDGDISTSNKGSNDIWLLKIDTLGNIVWEKSYGSSAFDVARSLTKVSGGFLILGSSLGSDGDITPGGFVEAGGWMIMIDNQGNKLWDKSFGHIGCKNLIAGKITGDNSLLVIGSGFQTPADSVSGNTDIFLLHFDLSYQLIKTEFWGGSEEDIVGDVLFDEDNARIYYTGSTKSSDGDFPINKGMEDVWLAMSDYDGNLLYATTFGGSFDDAGLNLLLPYPGILWLASTTFSIDGEAIGNQNQNRENIWVRQYRIDTTWVSLNSLEAFSFRVFPNPSLNGRFQLSTETNPFSENIEIQLTDVMGRDIPFTSLVNDTRVSLELQITMPQSGIYYLHISDNGKYQAFPLRIVEDY
jgi:hypothetical protein